MDKRLKIEDIFTHPWVVGFEKEQEAKNKKDERKKYSEKNMHSKLNVAWNSASAGFYKCKENEEEKVQSVDLSPDNLYVKRKIERNNSSKVRNESDKGSSNKVLNKVVVSPKKEAIYNYRKKEDNIISKFLLTSISL